MNSGDSLCLVISGLGKTLFIDGNGTLFICSCKGYFDAYFIIYIDIQSACVMIIDGDDNTDICPLVLCHKRLDTGRLNNKKHNLHQC